MEVGFRRLNQPSTTLGPRRKARQGPAQSQQESAGWTEKGTQGLRSKEARHHRCRGESKAGVLPRLQRQPTQAKARWTSLRYAPDHGAQWMRVFLMGIPTASTSTWVLEISSTASSNTCRAHLMSTKDRVASTSKRAHSERSSVVRLLDQP